MKKVVILIAGLFISSVSYAEQYSINYNPSEIRSIEPIKSLHEKISETAQNHCPSYFQTRSLADRRSCVSDVVNDLVEQVDIPLPTAYHKGEMENRVARAES